jgi:hypothetical protein
MPPGDYSATVNSNQPVVTSQSSFGVFTGQVPEEYGQWTGAYSSNGTAQGTRFYLPNVCTRYSYYNFIGVQNAGGDSANVKVEYHGTQGDDYENSADVPPGTRYTFSSRETPGMPPGDYSAVVTSEKPVAVSQSTYCYYQGRYTAAYGSGGIGEDAVGNTLYLPNTCTRSGYQSYTGVMVVGGGPADVTATYTGTAGDSYQQEATLDQYSRHTFNAGEVPGMPPGDYALTLQSDQPIAASQSVFGVFEGQKPEERGMWPGAYGYNGISNQQSTRLFMPNICTQPSYYSYIGVQSIGGEQANVEVKYYGDSGLAGRQTALIPASSRSTFSPQDLPDMPPGDYSAVIESDQPIAAAQSTFCFYNKNDDHYPAAYGSRDAGLIPVR